MEKTEKESLNNDLQKLELTIINAVNVFQNESGLIVDDIRLDKRDSINNVVTLQISYLRCK